MVGIRRMALTDLDDVWEIEKECFTIPWTKKAFSIEISENRCAYYVVAHIGEELIGYGGMWLMIDEAHITNIAVHPSYRNVGVGSLILNSLICNAAKNDIFKMTLEVRVSNNAALKVYSKLGFKAGGVRKRYYSDNDEDALIMWKTLTEEEISLSKKRIEG